MTGSTGGSGGISRFGARTGEAPRLDLADLYTGEGSRSGTVPKVSLADISLEETWYDHHNVPLLGYARATVSLVEIDELTELHAGLGAKLAEMQGERKPPDGVG